MTGTQDRKNRDWGGYTHQPQPEKAMRGTLRTTESGSHTWTRGITREAAIKRFKRLGDVRTRGNTIYVTRFCGGKIKAVFYPPRAEMTKKTEDFREAVANGGLLTHIKPFGKHAALCGHSPSSPKGFQFHRGRWKSITMVDIDAKRFRWCRKCRIRYLKAIGDFKRAMAE